MLYCRNFEHSFVSSYFEILSSLQIVYFFCFSRVSTLAYMQNSGS